jgi:hypothetical protein
MQSNRQEVQYLGDMLSTVANWLFGCSHRRTSFPITLRDPSAGRRGKRSEETYVVCLDCGKHFAYDWAEMRVAKQPFATVESVGAERGMRVRGALPAGSRLFQRLVHHT